MSVLLPPDALQKPPLDGITVIDMSRFSRVRIAPWSWRIWGPSVIKIERPDIAHQVCPYSRATHGNIAVETTLV
jgi:crotonobetainyl-CoA:carnitine CoA-transferase CaiB-like acyl-CoA transferase